MVAGAGGRTGANIDQRPDEVDDVWAGTERADAGRHRLIPCPDDGIGTDTCSGGASHSLPLHGINVVSILTICSLSALALSVRARELNCR
ncbi:jg21421 [Pararge aegeria aegeria]|uniref:Jg21421 protein n=1 Tax=Pararge aegeria aegeria TaxID=348720 RepID=A0A8S4QYT6_9NEOP|nr:jg21421 [Pararge aegeria aegeria]